MFQKYEMCFTLTKLKLISLPYVTNFAKIIMMWFPSEHFALFTGSMQIISPGSTHIKYINNK